MTDPAPPAIALILLLIALLATWPAWGMALVYSIKLLLRRR